MRISQQMRLTMWVMTRAEAHGMHAGNAGASRQRRSKPWLRTPILTLHQRFPFGPHLASVPCSTRPITTPALDCRTRRVTLNPMTKRLLGFAVALLVGIPPLSRASILQLDAPALFEQSVTRDLRLSHGGDEIQLESGELFEDDGPASG